MFRWYSCAQICYAYLDDIKQAQCQVDDGPNTFAKSLWFTRGWTLQELLAPTEVEFYAEDWTSLGTKLELSMVIAEITSIDVSAIEDFETSQFSVAQRILWAAMRTTTRREDEAYCLMGLLEVHMPLLYGEGANAFRRLQEEVIQTSADQSILAWTWEASEVVGLPCKAMSPFAKSPRQFAEAGQIVSYPNDDLCGSIGSMATINKSLQITLPIVQGVSCDVHALLACRYRDNSDGSIGIALLRQGVNYIRFWHALLIVPLHCVANAPRKAIRIDPSIPFSSRYNGCPSGFVILSTFSVRSTTIVPISAYPNELWNSRSQTFNFPNLSLIDYAEPEHFALTLSDRKQSVTLVLGLWNSTETHHGPDGVEYIRSKYSGVWCDVAEAATEDDVEKIWEVSSGPRDEVWGYGLKIRRIGWQETWTISIAPKRLMGAAVWAVMFEKSDPSEEPSKRICFAALVGLSRSQCLG